MIDSLSNTESRELEPFELLEAVNALYQVSSGDGSESNPLVDIPTLDSYLKTLDDLCERAGKLEYTGLQSACLCLAENVRNLLGSAQQLDDPLRSVLENWPELLLNYLATPGDEGIARSLIEQLQLPVWDIPLPAEDAEMIEILLAGERPPAGITAGDDRFEVADEGGCPGSEPLPAEESTKGDKDLDAELPTQIHDLTAMLIEELPLLEEPLLKLIEMEPGSDSQGWEAAFEVYDDYLERFGEATASIGFAGLHRVVTLMRENLGLLVVLGRALSPREKELLLSWRGHAFNYLNNPCNQSTGQALLEWLQDSAWPMPLAAEETTGLLSTLQAPEFPAAEEEEETETRPQRATAEDVEIRLPEDVNMDLLDAMLQELPNQTETFSAAIQNLIQGGSMEDINVAQRMAHTLKGAANTVGVSGIPTLTHHLEDILVALAKQRVLPPPPLSQALMDAADCLEAMGEVLCGISEVPDNAQKVLQELLDWANRIDREGLPSESLESQVSESRPNAPPSAGSEGEPPGPQQNPAPKSSLKTELVDNLLRMGGETIILSGQVKEQVRQIEQRIRAMQSEFARIHQLGGELERLIDIRDLSHNRQQQTSSAFDSLEMDQYSELHTTSRMLVEAATDAHQIGSMVAAQLGRLDKMLLTQERLNHELQETVLNARMVPIKTVVPRLQRSVRQTCRLTEKQAELHITGTDTLMDSEVLTKLVDPLMHVLRNAVDHGIEAPTERKAAGKSELGNIWLDFQRDGNNILVRCRDDGTGLDFTAIRATAERRGLVQSDQTVTDDELKNMLLIPNFSTRSEVTQTSGRGVGLDVVYSHIINQGGSLTLKSTAGGGCTTEMRLPLSLISTHALLIRLRDQIVAVADRGIEQILHATDGTPRELAEQDVFWVEDQVYHFKPLDEILQQAPDCRTATRDSMPVLLVNTRTGINAVPVQEILRGSDLVVKEFGRYVPRMPGILGATILGDGAVTPVLDLPELMSGVHRPPDQMTDTAVVVDQALSSLPLALVVDDSLSARKALVQIMEDAGYEVREARDGMEAVQLVEARRPDIVLADMEMPRMNGIELTAHLRTRRETADLPVIMITSRSTAKHRRQAEAAGVDVYLTKPFLDDELLDQVAGLRSRQ
jgi:chemosensory pili system protein ChpA (sensor histidine kinase/response regulator)